MSLEEVLTSNPFSDCHVLEYYEMENFPEDLLKYFKLVFLENKQQTYSIFQFSRANIFIIFPPYYCLVFQGLDNPYWVSIQNFPTNIQK